MTSLERHEELWCITGPRSESILRWIQWRSLLYASWMSFPCHVRPVSHTKINWDYQLTSHQPLWIQISLCFLSKVKTQHLCTERVCARVCYYYIYIYFFFSILQKLPLYFALQQLLNHHARRVARGEKDDRRGFAEEGVALRGNWRPFRYLNIKWGPSRWAGRKQDRHRLTAARRTSFIFTRAGMLRGATGSHPGACPDSIYFLQSVPELFPVTTSWTRHGRTPALRYGMQIRTLTSAIMWLLA